MRTAILFLFAGLRPRLRTHRDEVCAGRDAEMKKAGRQRSGCWVVTAGGEADVQVVVE
jgi:hypothetical protein